MAIGCRVVEPNGKITVLTAEDRDQIRGRVDAVLGKWRKYCEANWLNDSGDVYPPEAKVKRFLDSLAYFLMFGNLQGIETDYKHVMHTKREIPISNCPSSIDNLVYSSGASCGAAKQEEDDAFAVMLDRLDRRAEPYMQPKVKRKFPETRFHKHERLGIRGGEWCVVDTEGKFRYRGKTYQITDQATQYQPIETLYGDLYDMDRILASGGKFYDMNFDEVEVIPAS